MLDAPKRDQRAVIYARISEDPSGEALGVERQVESCRAYAQAHGYQIVQEVWDNDISALLGKTRPGYQRVMQLVSQGAVRAVIVWQTSRLVRNRSERAAMIELGRDRGVSILAVKGPSMDLSTAYGRGMAGLLGEFDTMESEVKSERVRAAAAQRAKKGQPNGSLGYGWVKVAGQWVEEPAEAAVVREILQRLASRETLLAVTADLNARGIPSPELAVWQRTPEVTRQQRLSAGRKEPQATWGKTSVKKLALRQSNVAERVHHKGRPDEKTVKGAWPALVERPLWSEARRILTAPERRTNGNAGSRPGARSHLLTWGIGECGVCGGKLRVARRKGRSATITTQVLYVCEGHEHVGRNQAKVDNLVRLVVMERLARPDALDWLMGDEEAAKRADARVRERTARLEDAGSMFARGTITGETLEAITAELRPLIDEAKEERNRQVGSRDLAALTDLAGSAAETRWSEMTVVQQRAVLQTLSLRVVIDRAPRGPVFDERSVRFEWGR